MISANAIRSTLNAQALIELIAAWKFDSPEMGVFALLPEAEKHNLPVLQAVCRQAEIPLVGGIFPALVTDSGFCSHGAWLLRFNKMPFVMISADMNSENADIGGKIAILEQQLPDNPIRSAKPTLFMVLDAMLPNIASILDQLYLCLSDRVRYAAVNAGSETFQAMPCLFDAEQLIGDGILALLLPDSTAFVLEHGYPAPENVMVATSSEKNLIISIDWRPAFDVYKEIIDREYGIALTRENFYNYAVHFPFGILRANGQVVVRIPVALDDNGSIYCVGEIPENTMLALLRAPPVTDTFCIDRIVEGILADSDISKQQPLLTFYCAGRRMHLGKSAEIELANLKQQSFASKLVGALSLGEISGHQSDYPIFHNAALICRPWIGV